MNLLRQLGVRAAQENRPVEEMLHMLLLDGETTYAGLLAAIHEAWNHSSLQGLVITSEGMPAQYFGVDSFLCEPGDRWRIRHCALQAIQNYANLEHGKKGLEGMCVYPKRLPWVIDKLIRWFRWPR